MSRTTRAINHIIEELNSIGGLWYDESVEKIEKYVVREVEKIKKLHKETYENIVLRGNRK